MYKTLAALVLVATATAATAQTDSRLLERLRAADSNGDSAISRAELIAYRATNFTRIDRNGDGALTDDDIPFFMRGRGGPVDIASLKAQFDRNRDGRVSRDEFVNGPTLMFDLADTNRDGILTRAELDTAISRAKSARAG